VCNMRLAVEV